MHNERKVASRPRPRLLPSKPEVECAKASNENKISDGWRGGAWLRVEGRISWEVRNRDCQAFAASFG